MHLAWLLHMGVERCSLTIGTRSGTFKNEKPAIFHPKAKDAIRDFPVEIRREVGKVIFDLQQGESPGMPLCKPMPSVALGAGELRLKDSNGAHRVFFYRKSKAGILIFHAFTKKTRKTPYQEIELGKKRLREMLNGEV